VAQPLNNVDGPGKGRTGATIARLVAKRLIPGRTRRWLRSQLAVEPKVSKPDVETKSVVDYLRGKVPIRTIPSFAGDDLVSWHNPEFLTDPAFMRAVRRRAVTDRP
jgi:hypothetical protein